MPTPEEAVNALMRDLQILNPIAGATNATVQKVADALVVVSNDEGSDVSELQAQLDAINPSEGVLEADTIQEATTAAGVTIDSVLLKDGTVQLADGLVSALAIQLGADKNNGFYGVSDTQLGIAVEGALVAMATTTGLAADVVSELVTNNGVTADGVLLKDGGVSANSMFAAFYPTAAQQALAGPGAVNVTSYLTAFTSTGTGDALTLAAGTQIGQHKKVSYVGEGAGGDTGVLTLTGYTSITLNAIGDYVVLMWNGAAWFAIENVGCTIV